MPNAGSSPKNLVDDIFNRLQLGVTGYIAEFQKAGDDNFVAEFAPQGPRRPHKAPQGTYEDFKK